MKKKPPRKTPKPYHHGNLRQALVEAAVEMLSTAGQDGLSLRAVARAAGVSHMAPYHHFGDKRGLIAAIAAEGFSQLKTEMLARMAQCEGDPGRQLQEAAIATVLFAAANPDHYRLMFGPVLADRSELQELEAASQQAFDVILGCLQALHAGDLTATPAASGNRPPALGREIGLAAWAMAHGVAMLVIDGQFEAGPEEEIERIARAATDLLWHGLSSTGLA